MAKNRFDALDMALSGLFTLGTAVTVGVAEVQWFDVTFGEKFLSFGGVGLTFASILSLLILGVVYVTNDNDIRNMDEFYAASIALTVGLTVGIPLVPQLESWVVGSDFLASLVVIIMAIGYGAMSFIK